MEIKNRKHEQMYNLYMQYHYREDLEQLKKELKELDVRTLKMISNGGCIPIMSNSKNNLIDNIITTIRHRARVRKERNEVLSSVEWYGRE